MNCISIMIGRIIDVKDLIIVLMHATRILIVPSRIEKVASTFA